MVGGGGKVPGFTDKIADRLQIARERVAVRGEEVLTGIDFVTNEVKKDALLVTPIGICINYYNQKKDVYKRQGLGASEGNCRGRRRL